MAHISLRVRYFPLQVVPPVLLTLAARSLPRSKTRALLELLVEQPAGVELGTLHAHAQTVELAPSICWPGDADRRQRIPWRDIDAAVKGVRACLKGLSKEFPLGIWINRPAWDGRRYRQTVPVRVGLVDLNAPLGRDA